MARITKSRNALVEPIITIRRGLAIYKIGSSPFYIARMRDRKNDGYICRSTKETARIAARKAAEELYITLSASGDLEKTPAKYTFAHFSQLLLDKIQFDVKKGDRAATLTKDTRLILKQNEWGLLPFFGKKDIREIKTKDFADYTRRIQNKRGDLSKSIFTQVRVVFRKVMRMGVIDGVIDAIPDTSGLVSPARQQPRTYFHFYPLVPKERDEWARIKSVAKELAERGVKTSRGIITEELRDMLIFLFGSFLRPTYSEIYELKHSDITIRSGDTFINQDVAEASKKKNKEYLSLNVRTGKTGSRSVITMPSAATVYRRILRKRPRHKTDDYVFFPEYEDRHYAQKVGMAQFNYLLDKAGLKKCPLTGEPRSLYSIRHTALKARIIFSKGKVPHFLLAKQAGTSMEMFEKFYLKDLPLTDEAARSLQTFGDD